MRPRTLALLTLLPGCSQTLNPCPPGSKVDRAEDRCEPVLDVDGGASTASYDAQWPGDASAELDSRADENSSVG